MMEDSLQHKVTEAQQKDGWIRAVIKILEKEEYEDYYFKYEMLHKDPAKELMVKLVIMEREIIEMTHLQRHLSKC